MPSDETKTLACSGRGNWEDSSDSNWDISFVALESQSQNKTELFLSLWLSAFLIDVSNFFTLDSQFSLFELSANRTQGRNWSRDWAHRSSRKGKQADSFLTVLRNFVLISRGFNSAAETDSRDFCYSGTTNSWEKFLVFVVEFHSLSHE